MANEELKSAGILLDNWKVESFTKILDANGFEYSAHPYALVEEKLTMLVVGFYPSQFDKLNVLVHEAEKECEEKKVVH